MLSNNLKLNNGKTELLVLHSKYRPQSSLDVISVGNTQVSPSDEARNLGANFDSTMGYEKHISEICKSAFYHIRYISHVRRYLNVESTEKLYLCELISPYQPRRALRSSDRYSRHIS